MPDPSPVRRTTCVAVPDLTGGLRCKYVPGRAADTLATADLPAFASIILVFDEHERVVPVPDGHRVWWPSWDTGFEDLFAVRDSPVRTPAWRPGEDLVLVDLVHAGNDPVRIAPRQVLRGVHDRLAATGLTVRVGAEVEFFLRDAPGREPAAVLPSPAYAHVLPPADHAALLDVVEALHGSGVGVSSWCAEGGHRQYEISLAPSDPVTAADDVALSRAAVREICARRGLVADLDPKPGPGFGNGLHLHVSLHDARGTLFRPGGGRPHGPGAQALAGLLDVLPAATALLCPTGAAMRRLEPHTAAGTTAAWSLENRSAGVRLLDRADASRVEVRVPSSDASPYLAVAAVLAGMQHGLHTEQPLPEPFTRDAYSAAPAEARLPTDLATAARLLRDSAPLRSVLGDALVDHVAGMRSWVAENPPE